MVGFIEATCTKALRPYLAPDQRMVGTRIEVSHVAATPVGMIVTASVELIEVDGRRLRFAVECRDDAELIGAGHHERFIVDAARFLASPERKRTDGAEPRGAGHTVGRGAPYAGDRPSESPRCRAMARRLQVRLIAVRQA